MIKLFLKRHILKNRDLILQESQHMNDLMRLLMKRKNSGVKWTREEIIRLKSHIKHLSLYVPVLIVFVLPFGSLLLPVLAETLDRREKS
jgi:hypothetical protein